MSERNYFYPGVIRQDESGEYLVAGKCPVCGKMEFPKPEYCAHCGATEIEEVALSKTGSLVSYTTTFMPVQKFAPPHSVGYVQLSDEIRIFTPLILDPEHPFKVDGKMELEICEYWKDDEGNPVEGFKFRPVD